MNILCFGDSNTYGYNPKNGFRYDKNTRWTGILQNLLGDKFNIIEEGLNGRTIAFDDPYMYGRCGLDDIIPVMSLHKPIDLLIIMLGTNDTKETFHATSTEITRNLEILINKVNSEANNFRNNNPQILIIAPFPILSDVIYTPWADEMGKDCSQKSFELIDKYKELAHKLNCYFFDPSPYGKTCDLDCIHLSEETHHILAHKLYEFITSKIYK